MVVHDALSNDVRECLEPLLRDRPPKDVRLPYGANGSGQGWEIRELVVVAKSFVGPRSLLQTGFNLYGAVDEKVYA